MQCSAVQWQACWIPAGVLLDFYWIQQGTRSSTPQHATAGSVQQGPAGYTARCCRADATVRAGLLTWQHLPWCGWDWMNIYRALLREHFVWEGRGLSGNSKRTNERHKELLTVRSCWSICIRIDHKNHVDYLCFLVFTIYIEANSNFCF